MKLFPGRLGNRGLTWEREAGRGPPGSPQRGEGPGEGPVSLHGGAPPTGEQGTEAGEALGGWSSKAGRGEDG